MKCPVCGAENPKDNKYCGDCGSMIAMVTLVQPTQPITREPKPPYQIRVNLICLAGAILGVLSLFMPWALVDAPFQDDPTNIGAFDFDENLQGGYSFPVNFQLTMILFMIGTLVAFLLPLGGVLQLIGSLGFILTSVTYSKIGSNEIIFWIGAAIATISSAMVIVGLAFPGGIGFAEGKRTAMDRLLTVSLFR